MLANIDLDAAKVKPSRVKAAVFVNQGRINSDGSTISKFRLERSKVVDRFEVGVDMAGSATAYTHFSGLLVPAQFVPLCPMINLC